MIGLETYKERVNDIAVPTKYMSKTSVCMFIALYLLLNLGY